MYDEKEKGVGVNSGFCRQLSTITGYAKFATLAGKSKVRSRKFCMEHYQRFVSPPAVVCSETIHSRLSRVNFIFINFSHLLAIFCEAFFWGNS